MNVRQHPLQNANKSAVSLAKEAENKTFDMPNLSAINWPPPGWC